jgi:ADP-ribosylglycohydrolase
MRASPIGLWDYDDIGKLVSDSEIQSVITHTDKRCTIGATLVAAAVAYNIRNDAFEPAAFLESLRPLCNREGGEDFARYFELMGRLLAMPEEEAASTIAKAGQERKFEKDYITPFVVPTVLISCYAFLKYPEDFLEALAVVYRARGDIDTTGAITGAISGSHLGEAGIPAHLAREVVERKRIIDVAEKLCEMKSAAR